MSQQFCTFHIAEHFFGIEVNKVQEVVRHQTLTPVPLAPPDVSGLINLRGQIITAIDLRTRLGLPRQAADRPSMNVLVSSDDGIVSFQVDRIGDVLDVDPGTLEEPPATLKASLRPFIRAVSKQKDVLLLALDDVRTCEASD